MGEVIKRAVDGEELEPWPEDFIYGESGRYAVVLAADYDALLADARRLRKELDWATYRIGCVPEAIFRLLLATAYMEKTS